MSARTAVVIVAIACLALTAAMIANADGGGSRETTENDQAFAWPASSDTSLGTVELKELGEDSVAFAAFCKPGAGFVRWVGPEGKIVTDAVIVLGFSEGSSWTAMFEPKAEEA